MFAVDQSTLTPDAQAVLDGQASWMLTNVDYSALIEEATLLSFVA